MAAMINPPQVLSEEPTAVTPHGGFCGGESQQWLSYPTKLHVRICEGGVERSTPLLDPVARSGPAELGERCILDDRFHETGIHGTGGMLVDSSFETERGVVSWQDGGKRSRWR